MMALPPGFYLQRSLMLIHASSPLPEVTPPIEQYPTIGEMRRTRYQELAPPLAAICHYLEQLASQTATNIDDWTLEPFSHLGPTDRRAINHAFFARKELNLEDTAKLTLELEAALAETAIKTSELHQERIEELTQTHQNSLREANRYQMNANAQVARAWEAKKELYSLESKPANYLVDELKKLLLEGFWGFQKYADATLFLETKNDIILTEKNSAAGIDRSVNMGRYLGVLQVKAMELTVWRFKDNAVTRGGYFHPYVSSGSSICWGTAVHTADSFLSRGALYDAYKLLASLLTTYNPSATPYVSLLEFSGLSKRIHAGEAATEVSSTICASCDEAIDACTCDCCSECENSDCTCCTICNGHDRDNCGCCRECENEECTCNRCDICGENDRDNCDCCRECENTLDNCEACSVCHEHGGCECCAYCHRTRRGLERLGHDGDCARANAEPAQSEEVATAPTISETPSTDDLPF